MKFSIFGSKGFIGSNMTSYLKNQKIECDELEPDDEQIFEKPLGHVIYCIGVTADFRERPFDTVEAHVCTLHKILKKCNFDSFLYLSSTRVYLDSISTNETEQLLVNPNNLDNLYNISKLMGESLCFASEAQNVRIARLSNVVGNNKDHNDFLSSIIHDAVYNKKIILHTVPDSEKDFVCIEDVVRCLQMITLNGTKKIYNIASGKNTKIIEITNKLNCIVNCKINFGKDCLNKSFPIINIKRIQEEFKFKPSPFLFKLKEMVQLETEKLNHFRNNE